MGAEETRVYSIERPHPNLLKYYTFLSCLLGPFFPIAFLPGYLKYKTLRYAFDHEGVSMSWGKLFHRETRLNYTRLQDIHLASNAVERWFGLARVQLQTASGSAGPEMTLVGIDRYEEVRDFLYLRMQGVEEDAKPRTGANPSAAQATVGTSTDTLLADIAEALRSVASELAATRAEIQGSQSATEGEE